MATLDDDKLRVLEASDIAEVVGEYVRLVPNGREFKCLCPFHDDNNPSMYVVPHKRMFHCFVCGAGGDVFTFIQRYHGIGFGEAMRMLAERAGLELTPRHERKPRRTDGSGNELPEVSRADLLEANRIAQAFFRTILSNHPGGQTARDLVEKRGIAPEMVERFGLGAAPDRWDGLLQTVQRKGLPLAPFIGAGLLKKKERPEPYDAMRHRLIFPIHGETGDPIAFGGRRVNDEDDPKYLNSPETALFNKSKTLFGLPMARTAMRDAGRAVVVEGYTDVIACHQAGLENVVGTLGTAFTAGHAQRLRSQCAEVVLLFDGDEAGQNAADRAIDVLIAARVDIRVALLTEEMGAKDPDELLAQEGGADRLRAVLDSAEPVLERWARRITEKQADLGPAARARLLDDQIARLAQVGLDNLSPIERSSMLESLSGALGVPVRIVAETYERQRRPGRRAQEAMDDAGPAPDAPVTLRPVDRFRLLALSAYLDAAGGPGIDRARVASALRVGLEGCHPALAGAMHRAIGAIEGGGGSGGGLSAASLLAGIDDPEAGSVVAGVIAAPDRPGADEGDAQAIAEELEQCVRRLEEYALASPEAKPADDRLARLRSLHTGHGVNHAANPYRFGSGRGAGGAGPGGLDR
jgi:DNA primase